ncbi:MAG: ABC transporter ATP-binding protein [Acidimicrobiia bacterium]|nr:ABC transporter ATP-binding protein [Acidimicrobiia bacterium]MDH3396876.1 ABC transporter ATP-binding protein [Acidimicrobiia bacterium]MDH5615720.1 ABC transporter ATP-binding protein [Acidimicrobiia bacterium]
MIVRTSQLRKDYGSTVALRNVDLQVPSGSVYGLVGPNGAGKTTLLGVLAGLRRPTSGTVEIDAEWTKVAVLPDTPQFDAWLTGREVVDLARSLTDASVPASRVDEVLEQAGLADAARRTVGGYSRGMLQRLGVASTVVGRPTLLMLDEPSSALDPAGRREVLDLVARLRGEATVIFSSHILGDVQEVCDTVGILRAGELLFQGPINRLLVGSAVPTYRLRMRPPSEAAVSALRDAPWVRSIERVSGEEVRIFVESVEAAEKHLAAALAGTDVRIVSFGPEAATLEQVFLELTS